MIQRQQKYNDPRLHEKGSALVYILIAIALLAALTISFMQPSTQGVSGNNTFKAVSELQSQIDYVRANIQECVLLYPGGDSVAITNGAQPNQPYPIMPDDGFFDTHCGAGESAANNNVTGLRCPGNPGDNACHGDMWGGSTGKFLQPPPALFGPWKYYSGVDGVFIYIETSKTDPYITSVLEKLDTEYSECEADVVTGGGTGVDLDSGSTLQCGANTRCFRIRLVANTATDVYNGDADNDEVACP